MKTLFLTILASAFFSLGIGFAEPTMEPLEVRATSVRGFVEQGAMQNPNECVLRIYEGLDSKTGESIFLLEVETDEKALISYRIDLDGSDLPLPTGVDLSRHLKDEVSSWYTNRAEALGHESFVKRGGRYVETSVWIWIDPYLGEPKKLILERYWAYRKFSDPHDLWGRDGFPIEQLECHFDS